MGLLGYGASCLVPSYGRPLCPWLENVILGRLMCNRAIGQWPLGMGLRDIQNSVAERPHPGQQGKQILSAARGQKLDDKAEMGVVVLASRQK